MLIVDFVVEKIELETKFTFINKYSLDVGCFYVDIESRAANVVLE